MPVGEPKTMHSWHRAAVVALSLALSVLTTAGCGDTNTINQQAGGDSVACVDDASCSVAKGVEGAESTGGSATARSDEAASAGASEASSSEGSSDSSGESASQTSAPRDEAGDDIDTGDAASGGDSSNQGSSNGSSSDGSSSGDGSAVAPQSGPFYLSDLKPVGGLGNDKRTGAAELASGTYGNSVIFSPRYFGSQRLDVTYNIPQGTKTFAATVGLDQETPDGTKVFFELSGAARDSFTLVPGQTHEVNKGIAGTGRVTLTVEVLARPSGDAVNSLCRAVWGDARFD